MNVFFTNRNPHIAAPDEFKQLAQDFDVPTAYQHYLCDKFREWKRRDSLMRVEWTCRTPHWYKILGGDR